MTEQATAATGGITNEQINAAVTAAVSSALATAIKPLTDTLAQVQKDQGVLADTLKALPPAGIDPKAADKNAAATSGDTKSLTVEDIQKLLDERDNKRQQQQDLGKNREQFVKDKLAKVPAVYASKLGDDPAKWEDEAKTLQTQYEADLKANGFKPVDIKGAVAGGDPAAKLPVDISKMSAAQQKDAALKALTPVTTPAPVTDQASATATAAATA